MSAKALYRRLVPFNLRFRVGAVRSALKAPNQPEIFLRSLARWQAERTEDSLSELPLGPNSVAVDVGAYKGRWCSDISARFRCRVIAVEPVSAFSEAIKQRFTYNPDVEIHQVALGSGSRTEEVSVLGDASSTLRTGSVRETILFVDVAEWLSTLGTPQINAMQINCEGGEFELLPRLAEAGWLSKIDHLLIQFHLVGSSPEEARDGIRETLQETHEEVFSYPFVWEHWRRKDPLK